MKRRGESFNLDNHITWYLKDYEDNKEKQRKLIERNNGELFYIFGTSLTREVQDGRTMGES